LIRETIRLSFYERLCYNVWLITHKSFCNRAKKACSRTVEGNASCRFAALLRRFLRDDPWLINRLLWIAL
ncbi:MAG: hypothetical protein IJX18_02880, partial [Clostridia bacterium]|nr:hypothetical protein [Clostridia bacterium]